MNYSFNVKFKIFDDYSLTKQRILSKKQQNIRQQLCNDFNLILQNSIKDHSDILKHLVRCEPAICSIDEKKQLRMCLNSYMNTNTDSQYIIMDQHSGEEFFSIEEMKLICNKIKQELEEYLNYDIDAYLYIDIEYL